MDLITKVALGKTITDREIENELYEICDREHSTCSDVCPVFNFAHIAIGKCDCFKNGKKMLQVLRENNNSY